MPYSTNTDMMVENFTYFTEFVFSTFPDATSIIADGNGGDDTGPSTLDMVLGVAMVLLIIPTVTGNALILIAFWKSRRLRTYFNYFICSMAFADLTVGAVNMPVYSIQFFSGRWPFGARACLIFSIIDHVFVHVSVLSVVVIAIDRYKSLVNPLQHLRKKSLGRAAVSILPTYIIPIPLWTWFVLFRKQGRHGHCYTGKRGEFPFNFVTPFVLYIFPLIILSSFCLAIYRIIRSRNVKRLYAPDGRGLALASSKRNARIISSSVATSEFEFSGATNPTYTTQEDTDFSQTVCHQHLKLETINDLIAGNTTSPSKPDGSFNEKSVEQTANLGEPTPTADPQEGKSSLNGNDRNDPAEIHVVDVKGEPCLTVPDSNNSHHNSTTDLTESGTKPRADLSMSRQSEENKKAFRTLVFIVSALVISWSPWVLFVFIENICGRKCNVESVYHVSFFWVYVNSLLNPFCYAAANRTFRRVIRDFFRR